jgi:hypothetical protein
MVISHVPMGVNVAVWSNWGVYVIVDSEAELSIGMGI